jgi:hypothetical protein
MQTSPWLQVVWIYIKLDLVFSNILWVKALYLELINFTTLSLIEQFIYWFFLLVMVNI